MNELRMFAFGESRVDGCKCPAAEAGVYPPHTVAAVFDRLASEEVSADEVEEVTRGTLDDAEAAALWWEAIAQAEREGMGAGVLARSREVARVLGWPPPAGAGGTGVGAASGAP